MFININIDKSSLTKSGIQGIANAIHSQVINQVDNEMVQYAILTSLATAVSDALPDDLKERATAVAEAEHQRLGCEGAEVTVDNLTFQVKHTPEYDFSHVKGWAAADRSVRALEKQTKVAKLDRKHIEEVAKLTLHPSSNPVSLTFNPKNR